MDGGSAGNARLQGCRRYESRDGRGRAKHDCMDAGGRATHGAVAEDARAESDSGDKAEE